MVYLRIIVVLLVVLSANPWVQGLALFGVALYAVAESWAANGKLASSPAS